MTEETRLKVFARSGYTCEICGKPVSQYGTAQLAHRIHKGKTAENHILPFIWNTYQKDRSRKWVQDYILESPLNLVPVCSIRCNDKANIFFKSVQRDELIKKIIESENLLEIF